jgi:hypothetical protein
MRHHLLYAVTRTVIAVLHHAIAAPPINHIDFVRPVGPDPRMVIAVPMAGLTPLHTPTTLVAASTAVAHDH